MSEPDPAADLEVHEEALAMLRDALSAVEQTPGVALSGDEHALLKCAESDLRALERGLANRVEQKRDRPEGDDA